MIKISPSGGRDQNLFILFQNTLTFFLVFKVLFLKHLRHDLKNILVCKWIPLKCFRGQFCKKSWPASRLFREKSSLGITQLMFKPDASLISSEARKIHKNAPKNRLPFQELPLHTDFHFFGPRGKQCGNGLYICG